MVIFQLCELARVDPTGGVCIVSPLFLLPGFSRCSNSEVVRGQLRSSQSGSTWLQVNDLYLPMQVGGFFLVRRNSTNGKLVVWDPVIRDSMGKKNAAGGVVGCVAQQANLMFCLECINASLVWWGFCFSVLLVVVWPYLQKPMAS